MSDSQKNFYKKLLGLKGEFAAVNFLKKSGYRLIKRNYKTPFGEADIVMEKDGFTVFVEVKTRSSTAFGEPREAVGLKKRQKYYDIANYYMSIEGEKNISFAVVEVLRGKINLIENAF